ncbi:MAG TPA: hypothetical protein VK272_01300 [Solirubrobacteraceae bacterium]|nr:hypothetical protein [Solirubrobacteraceae bacterium]
MQVPDVLLPSFRAHPLSLAWFAQQMPVVIYLYPGGSSCADGERSLVLDAVEHRAFRDHQADLAAMRYSVIGISSQPTGVQLNSAFACRLDHELLSDPQLLLARALDLPTFAADGERRYERLTLIARGGRIQRAFFPVAAERSAAQALAWIRLHGGHADSSGDAG